MSQSIKMKIAIAGRQYPLTVAAHEEALVRTAGKQINDMIKKYDEEYDVKDKQDALAMLALQSFTAQLSQNKEIAAEDTNLNEQLQSLVRMLQST
ncbi:MAG: cell division protein ZapA [Weeksellaceae bacterium]|nr:cell division protein ZapA [Weeksellaceae bacterium]